MSGYINYGSDNWLKKFKEIILVTKSYRFALIKREFDKKLNKFRFGEIITDIGIKQPKAEFALPNVANWQLAVVHLLKWHDSTRIWDRICSYRDMFLAEQIAWKCEDMKEKNDFRVRKTLDGYLDFHQSTHDELCLNLYQNALERVVAVLTPPSNRIVSLGDRLVEPVLQKFFATNVSDASPDDQNSKGLKLGSVLVDGHLLPGDEESGEGKNRIIHFFRHESSSKFGYIFLFHWLVEKKIIKPVAEKKRKQRIGKTSAIAKNGYKGRCFEVPRFGKDGKLSIGKRTPQQTYADWQENNNTICKAGHWDYQGHHDFLTLNIEKAVAVSCLTKGKLVQFLMEEIFPFIGLEKNDLLPEWYDIYEKSPPVCDGILVYRSHPSTDAIIHKLYQEILNEKGREKAWKRTIPILPVQTHWGSSTLLIPPERREDIREKIESDREINSKRRPVLLFDDAAITGRTLDSLRAMLRSLGADDIRILVIVNRLRLPADGTGPDWMKYYWRFDVPDMGQGENHCPLCHALNLLDSFAESLSSQEAKNTIKKWQKDWKAKGPLHDWSAGLPRLPVREEGPHKFSFRDGRCLVHDIVLNKSIGLTVFISESHSMTGSDDYCLRKIDAQSQHEVKIEIAASQLLLFANELSTDIRLKLLSRLIVSLLQIDRIYYDSLAVLVAIHEIKSHDKDDRSKLHNILIDIDESQIESSQALQIFFAFLVNEKIITQQATGKIRTFYKYGLSLLKMDAWPLAERLNSWFLELHQEKTGNRHFRAITKLEELTFKKSILSLSEKDCEYIQRALNSMDHLQNIIKGVLETGLIRKDQPEESKKEQSLDYITRLYRNTYEQLKKLKDEIGLGRNKTEDNAQQFRDLFRTCELELKLYREHMGAGDRIGVADGLFVCVRNMGNKCNIFSEILCKIVDRLDTAGKLKDKENPLQTKIVRVTRSKKNFSSTQERVWIVWHSGIERIVEDLIGNCCNAGDPIPDPFCELDGEAHMWIQIDYQETRLYVTLKNALKPTEEKESQQIFAVMKRYRWSALEKAMGGKISLDEQNTSASGSNPKIFSLKIEIPYAGYLKSEAA